MENNQQLVWCNIAQKHIPVNISPEDCPCKDFCGYQIVMCPLLRKK